MHLAHPLGIAAGEVVVDGDHMHPAAGEGVEVAGQGGHQRFAFAGLHLSDLALVQHHAADQLHVEVAHAEHALAGFPYHREGLGQDLVEHRPLVFKAAGVGQALTELGRAAAQVVVAEGGDVLLKHVHICDDRLIALELAGIGITQQELEHGEGSAEIDAAAY